MVNKNWKSLENQSIREHADREGVFLWEIAAYLGRSDMWVTRKLRVPLNEKDSDMFNRAIAAIAARKSAMQEG